MKITLKFITLFVFLALLIPAGSVHAQGPNPGGGGRVIFGSNFTLESDDTFNGDLVVFGGNVTIEEDATLNGNLVVFGGTITSSGEILGDVLVVGGQVRLEEPAVVAGDVVTIGGQLDRAPGATIEGEVVNNVPPNIEFPDGRIPPVIPDVPAVPDIPNPNVNVFYNPFADLFWVFFWAVIVSAFAMLIALFWQPQLERAGALIVSQPLMSGAIGLLALFLGVILFLTILPPLIVAFAWLFGVVALGSEVGARFTKAINQVWTPVLTIGFGTFLLMLVGGGLGLIPCLGGLIQFLLGLLGIGGAVLTWFGSRLVQLPATTVYTPPTDSSQVPPAS
ncbi:MAG TPA: polymer-forming cytoskeletal protein [Anaerolineales bacterium]|nr:polymer-forming cytoskeletal protein [Anaerolineales bacterium]